MSGCMYKVSFCLMHFVICSFFFICLVFPWLLFVFEFMFRLYVKDEFVQLLVQLIDIQLQYNSNLHMFKFR